MFPERMLGGPFALIETQSPSSRSLLQLQQIGQYLTNTWWSTDFGECQE